MKNFFSSKLNVILTFLLALVIGVGIFFCITIFQKPATICADFSNMNEAEIATWTKDNEAGELIVVEYEYDEVIPEGTVIYQSIKAGEKLTEKCTIYISKGIDPNTKYEIVTNENTTLDTLKDELANYGITSFEVKYDETSDMEGIVLAISPNPVSKNDNIVITIGGKDPSKEIEESKDKVYIDEIDYLGKSESEFKAALNKLGFENLSKDSDGVYSPKRAKDVIAAYSPDGNQSTKTKITYYLSLGAYTNELATKEFDGLTLSKANDLVKTEKFSMYSYSLETTKTTTTEKPGGTLYDCTVSGTKIACKLSSNGTSNTKATISEYGYLGKSETEFKEALTKLGFTNIVKNEDGVYSSRKAGVIGAYSPDGEQPIDATITYYLSLGDYTNDLAKKDFDGKTLTEADALIAKDKFKMLGYKLTTTKTSTTEKTNDTLYDCLVSGKTISCKLASNSSSGTGTSTGTSDKKATISEYGYLGYTESAFKSALNNLGFTNLEKDAEGVYSSRNAGVIGAYSPDGNLPIDTKITYYLSLGNYTNALAKSDFEGKTLTEATGLIAKNKFALLGYKLSTTKTTSDKTNDTLYDCSVSGKTISCKLANNNGSSSSGGNSSGSSQSTTGYINPTSYAGNSETEFKNALKALGFTNVVKDDVGMYSSAVSAGKVAYYDPDGTQNLNTKITYWLSLGAYNSTLAANDFNGKTVSEANSILSAKKYSLSGISSSVATTETETSAYTAGTLYDCSFSNKKVACKLAKAVAETTTSYLGDLDYIAQNYSSTVSYSDAESKVRLYLTGQGFTNITITGVSHSKAIGQIISVSVAGNSNYSAGQYAKNSAIEVKIVNTQL